MADIETEVEVCVIGAGAGGAVVAEHAASANVSVVVLEAGRELNIPQSPPYWDWANGYTDLPNNMFMKKFAWPFDVVINPVMLDDTGNPVSNQCGQLARACGVGGTTLMYQALYGRLMPYEMDVWDSRALPENAQGGLNPENIYQYSHELPEQAWRNARWRFVRWRYELTQYYEKNEEFLGVEMPMGPDTRKYVSPGVYEDCGLDTHNAMILEGAGNFRVDSSDPDYDYLKDYFPTMTDSTGTYLYIPMHDANEDNPAYTDPLDPDTHKEVGGYRGSPCAVTGCWHCGNCYVGCWKKAKKSTAVSYLDPATRKSEVRSQCYVIAVLHSGNPDLPHLVVHGTYSDNPYVLNSISIQPSWVVVFAGGSIESPRLWLQSNWLLKNDLSFRDFLTSKIDEHFAESPYNISNASQYYVKTDENGDYYTLPQNPNVGKYLMTDNAFYAFGVYDKPVVSPSVDWQVGAVDPWVGQVGGAIVSIPHLGYIFFGGPLPATTYGFTAYGENVPKFGVEAKDFANNYANTLTFRIDSDDEPLPYNKVSLDAKTEIFTVTDPDISSLTLPVPAVQHHKSAYAEERCQKLGKVAKRVLESVNPGNADDTKPRLSQSYIMSMEADVSAGPIGTMMIGKVVSSDCEAYGTDGIYVADGSVLPGYMGRHRVNTIQAMALRTAEALCKKHLLNGKEWRDWENKVGTGHFL